MSDSLWPHGLQHTRPPCPSPTPGVYSNPCPLSWWCHPTMSSSVVPFSSIFPSISVFSNESALCIRWLKYWSFSFNISPSNEDPGVISFRMDWLDLLAVQGTCKNLLPHHSSKASIFRPSAFFTVQFSHPYMTSGKTITLTRWTFVDKVMSLSFNMLSRLVITFLPRSKCLLISWLQSPSVVILEPPKNKVSHCFPIYLPWSDGTGCHDLSFLHSGSWDLPAGHTFATGEIKVGECSGEPRFIHELRGAWESEEQISGSVLLLKITVHHFVEQLFIFPLKLVMYTQDTEQTYLHMCVRTCCIQFKAPSQRRQGYSYQVSNWAFPVPNYWKQPSHSHEDWVWFPCGHLSAKAVGFSVLLHSDGLWHLPTLGTGCLLLAAPNGQSSVPQVAQCPWCGLATCIYSPDETQRPVLAQGSGTPSQAMSHVSLVFTPGVDCLDQRVLYL